MDNKLIPAFDKLLVKLSTWFDTLVLSLPNLVIALLVFLAFY